MDKITKKDCKKSKFQSAFNFFHKEIALGIDRQYGNVW